MKAIGEHIFVFNEEDNGGESLMLETIMYDNGDGGREGLYYNQTLTLASYGNSASFNLSGTNLTPEILRKLADELEKEEEKALGKR